MLKIASVNILTKNYYCENFIQYLIQELSKKRTQNEIMYFIQLHGNLKLHKNLICKQLLIVNEYKINKSFDYCKIYNELLTLSKKFGKRPSTFNISGNIVIKMSHTLLVECRRIASADLRRFLIFNEYDIDPTSNLLSDIITENTDTDTDTIKL